MALPGIHTVLLLAFLYSRLLDSLGWQEGAAFSAGEDMEQLFSSFTF